MKALGWLALVLVPGGVGLMRQEEPRPAPQKVSTQLMFQGQAEEALGWYVSLLEGSRVLELERYGADDTGTEGTVKHATASLAGTEVHFIDTDVEHGFTFTAATSLRVTCTDVAELERLFAALSEDGRVFMPPDDYGFSARFAWVSDRFGVAWQLLVPD